MDIRGFFGTGAGADSREAPICHQIQLSQAASTAVASWLSIFPSGRDPRLKQQKLDLERGVGNQYITFGGGSRRASGHIGFGETLLQDINTTDREIHIYLQMTGGNGYTRGLAGIVKVDRRRLLRDLEIIGDEPEIKYDEDYYNHILMRDHHEYRIPVVPLEGTRIDFSNIVPYTETKPLGWSPARFSYRMKKIPTPEQFERLKALLY
jgi:hypothetical protein